MLLAALFAVATSDLRLELVRESLTGTHYRYRQYEGGLPTDDYVTTRAPLATGRSAGRTPTQGRLSIEGRAVQRRIVRESPFRPWAVDVDEATGAVIRRTPLFFNAKPARVFDPNPVVTLNAPELQDLNDQAGHIPAQAYRDVELPDTALHGPWVDLVDRQSPAIAPPEGALLFDRSADGFEDVSAYFHIDRNQQWVQSLGFRASRAIAAYAVPVDAHAAAGEDNSFFVPSGTQAGRGALFYGDGGTDDAEDADIVLHEYAHALMEWIAPGTFGGSFDSESRALSEGTADYWAFSAHLDARRASGRDPYCIADWDARCWLDASSERCAYPAGSDCLRRVDGTRTMADYQLGDSSGTPHLNGSIWSSALRELRDHLPREVMDTLVLESLFGVPPRPTFATMARRLIVTDHLLHQGAHVGLICTAMGKRGILAECEVPMLGELTHFQGGDHGTAIPDNDPNGITSAITIGDPRAIERLFVRVDIAHTVHGDLRIELIAPDGTVILLQSSSSSRTADIHVTYGLTAMPAESLEVLHGRSAAGVWTLRVADRAPLDRGTFLSWGLDIQFAGDVPQSTRPRGGRSQMIPVVAHLYGIDGLHSSDVRIASAGPAQNVTLIFTRSTKNGLTAFLATRVFVDEGQTLVLDDIVDRTFHTAGSGTLEVLGDVFVMSRMSLLGTNGSLGQDVPPVADTAARGASLIVAPFEEPGARYNLGVVETSGARGIVSVAGRELSIEPFSHVQIPVGAGLQVLRVIEGDAVIGGYLSQLRGGDAMFIPAQRPVAQTGVAPVITGQGSAPPEWRSDFWAAGEARFPLEVTITGAGTVMVETNLSFEDAIARFFHRTVTFGSMGVRTFGAVFVGTRIAHGETMQFVPFSQATGGIQTVLFVENGAESRTNLGIVSMEPVQAEITVYDASGTELERHSLATAGGFVQVPVANEVIGGRAVFRFTGPGAAYGSLIDRRSGDATFLRPLH